MSQTQLPQDPEGGQCYSTCSPQPQLGMERAGRARASQERKTAPRAGVGQQYVRAAIRSIALDQGVQEPMMRKTRDNKASWPLGHRSSLPPTL